MKQLWATYVARFEALNMRERGLVALTVLAAVLVFGYLVMLDPLFGRQRAAEEQLNQQAAELSDIKQKIAVAQMGTRDLEAANRANLEKSRKQIADINSRLLAIEQTLVPAERVTNFLEAILKGHARVQLVSLRNLPATSVVEPSKEAASTDRVDPAVKRAARLLKREDAIEGGGSAEPNINAVNGPLFKHGVEIIVVGSYGDLMNYVAALEKMPQKMLWNSVKLAVEEYPRSRMTLTIYTLSLDRTWLTV